MLDRGTRWHESRMRISSGAFKDNRSAQTASRRAQRARTWHRAAAGRRVRGVCETSRLFADASLDQRRSDLRAKDLSGSRIQVDRRRETFELGKAAHISDLGDDLGLSAKYSACNVSPCMRDDARAETLPPQRHQAECNRQHRNAEHCVDALVTVRYAEQEGLHRERDPRTPGECGKLSLEVSAKYNFLCHSSRYR